MVGSRRSVPLAQAAFLVLASIGLGGCPGTPGTVTGGDKATAAAGQSETAATASTVGNTNRIVVSYNDETNTSYNIIYAAYSRTVQSGASLMGWSYSDNGGASWTYGGKVSPPAGWAVLWGDPALTTSGANAATVFLSNLAVPTSKFPQGGVQGPINDYIGGACIAKSTDGGAHFSNYQCVSNKTPVGAYPDAVNGHFYDGGSLASGKSGDIYAAYVDVYTSQIDVYHAANENAQFQLMPAPFPGMTVLTHARLRVGPDGALYAATVVVATDGTLRVYMNRWLNGAWGSPTPASEPTVSYPSIDLNSVVAGSELTIRTGPQFSFDIGAASAGGNDAIRVLYTRQDNPDGNSPLYIGAVACAADLSHCHPVSGWQIGPNDPGATRLDVFSPNVVAWPGAKGEPASWQGTFAERYGASVTGTNVSRMTLGYVNGNAITVPVDILNNTPACSDTRGYQGDYNAMLLVAPQTNGNIYTRFYTNSTAGCTQRWEYVAKQQHVGSVQYTY